MTEAATKRPPTKFSASAICRRMDKQDTAIATVQRTVGDVAARMDQFVLVVQGIQKQMADDTKSYATQHGEMMGLLHGIKNVVGEEKEDGAGGMVSTGMMGRMRRAEKSIQNMLLQYKVWIAFGSGFMLCAGGFVAALWWLVGDKLAVVLK
jgi:hypothetical protein